MGLISLVSCIENDIPYPIQELYITEVEGDGFTVSINDLSRTVTLTLDEQTDIQNVSITTAECSPEATLTRDIVGVHDMTTPLLVTLYNYQSYDWSITAVQSIARYFTFDGQIGESVIDPANYTVTATANQERVSPDNVAITAMKLGASDVSTTTPSVEELTNFNSVRQVYVTTHGRTETWRITISFIEPTVSLTGCDVWATVAWLRAEGDTSGGDECGFMYRESGSGEWSKYVVSSVGDGYFEAKISGLKPLTIYEIKSYIGELESTVESRTSEDTPTLPNGDFESWSKPSKVIYPFLDEASRYWDTGNTGSTTLSENDNLTEGDSSDIRPGTSGTTSARLTSKFVGIGSLGKFAAGNIFVGAYERTLGMSGGIIALGRTFTQRPIALRGWVKYNCGVIDKVDQIPSGVEIVQNVTTDIGTIYMALGTWSPQSYTYSGTTYTATQQTPVFISTSDKSTIFDPAGDEVVAYGEVQYRASTDGWIEFEIPLNYYTTSVVPSNIIIVASASLYGDYFTGSTSSQMWVDDFELIYE